PPTAPAAGAPLPPLAGQGDVQAVLGTADIEILRSYAYDAGGNRKKEIAAGASPDYNFDLLDRNESLSYDRDGNALDATHVRLFDPQDRLLVPSGGCDAL